MSHWLQQKLQDAGLFVATADESTWTSVLRARPHNGEALHAKLVELCLVPLADADWNSLGRWVKASWDSVADGMRYYDICPHCSHAKCEADWVHNGVALVQCGPFHCDQCGATEMGPEDRDESKLTDEECKTGWYKGNNAHMTCAPTVCGTLVGDHRAAKRLYEMGLLDGPKPLGGGWKVVADDETRAAFDAACAQMDDASNLASNADDYDIDWSTVGNDDAPPF